MKKIISVLAMAFAVMAVITLSSTVKAAEEVKPYGKVDELGKNNDCVVGEVNITGNETKTVNVIYKNVTLKWVAKDTNIGRYQDGCWIGFKFNAPEVAKEKLDKAQYRGKWNWKGNSWSRSNFKEVEDSTADAKNTNQNRFVYTWLPMSNMTLNYIVANNIDTAFIYEFDWDGDGDFDQTVNIKFDTDTMKLETAANTETVTVVVGDKKFQVEKGKALKDDQFVKAYIEKLQADKTVEGLYYKADSKEIDMNKAVDSDVEITVKKVPATENKKEPAKKEEKDEQDNTPKMGVENVYAVAGVVVIVTIAGAIILNKRK